MLLYRNSISRSAGTFNALFMSVISVVVVVVVVLAVIVVVNKNEGMCIYLTLFFMSCYGD